MLKRTQAKFKASKSSIKMNSQCGQSAAGVLPDNNIEIAMDGDCIFC
jgi:hypothetical protein